MAKRTITYEKPGSPLAPHRFGRPTSRPVFDWNTVRPVARGETFPLFAAGIVLGFFATLVCYAKGYVLLYGDAVAHLAIARRILDAHYPGLSQLGGVWLPLPHLLMLPFVQNIRWWQSGLGGAPMSILSYAASVAGMWRLARRIMPPRWALVVAAFYALNANLLFLASTAMTEALFLALLVWTVVAAVEGIAAIRLRNPRSARRAMLIAGLLILCQVFTRYDGWIVGAVVWACFAYAIWRAEATLRKQLIPTFAVFTFLCAAGPALWLIYNAKYEGDWLDWMRGPYSAKQIERRTAPPGQHYRGWHNPGWALLFYMRTAQIDASAWETGWLVAMGALLGLWRQVRTAPDATTAGNRLLALLWLPLPFYIYSVAYGSVPIFIPQLWPHSYYNARYGMEMLPAFALYAVYALWRLVQFCSVKTVAWAKIFTHFAQPAAILLCITNCLAMMYRVPLVLKEGIVNATTRVPFEHALAQTLEEMPPNVPVMMYTSAHVGAVQVSGRTLRSMVSEQDDVAWRKALRDPAASAAFIISMAGDPVDAAVRAHPEGLKELAVICTTGQPCARVFRSDLWVSK